MKRKYGNDVKTILDYLEESSNELEKLENSDAIISDLKRKVSAAMTGAFLFRVKNMWYNERKNDHGEHGLARRILKIREIGDAERI